MDEKTGNYWRILEANLDWIRYSDAKATGILTIYGVIVSVLYSNASSVVDLIAGSDLRIVLTSISAIASFVAIFFGFRCINPRLVLPTYTSIMFFGSVAKNFASMEDYRKYTHEVLDSKVGLDDELARQIFINAKIAQKKFADVAISLRFFVISIIMLLIETLTYFITGA